MARDLARAWGGTCWSLTAAALFAGVGCSGGGEAPPSLNALSDPQVVFLVKNEVFAIRLDGTARRSLGKVGDDRHRTAWPRFLPDGRIAVLGNDMGAIFPYVGTTLGNDFQELRDMNVSINDALCGVTIGGASRLVFTASPWSTALPVTSTLYRMNPDQPALEAVWYEQGGAISHPAPFDDDHIVAVRSVNRATTNQVGDVSIVVLPLDGSRGAEPVVLADVPFGFWAASPAKLDDGRVVFIRRHINGYSDTDLGELFVIDHDGTVRSTEITGVIGLVAVGNQVVYEIGGATGVTDLVVTDLVGPPRNITNTPYVAEHLTWSD